MFDALAKAAPNGTRSIDSTSIRVQQAEKGGQRPGDWLLARRQDLAFRGIATIIPTNPTRKKSWPIDLEAYTERNPVERAFNRLKDFRRIAIRYGKLARNFAAAIALAAITIWWND